MNNIDLYTPAINHELFHQKFKMLLGDHYHGERQVLDGWANGFVDRDGKFVKEFQSTFRSCFWELYLNNIIREAGYEIDYTKHRPDFIIKGENIAIEAVVSNIKANGRKESEMNVDDINLNITASYVIEGYQEIILEAITRSSGAITTKSKKYFQYKNESWMNDDTKYIVAHSSYGQVNYGIEDYRPMLALLFGKLYDEQSNIFKDANTVIKPGTASEIAIGLFNKEEYSHISAVIFSSMCTMGKLTSIANSSKLDFGNRINVAYCLREDINNRKFLLHRIDKSNPETSQDGLFVFVNHNAKNKLSEEFLSSIGGTVIKKEGSKIKFKYTSPPVVRRLTMFEPLFQIMGGHNHMEDVTRCFNRDRFMKASDLNFRSKTRTRPSNSSLSSLFFLK